MTAPSRKPRAFTPDDLFAIHQDVTTRALEIMRAKNHDYGSAGGGSPFANFEATEALGIAQAETGILVRMADKLSRLATATRGNELRVKDESFEDTIHDVVNYAILLLAYRRSRALGIVGTVRTGRGKG